MSAAEVDTLNALFEKLENLLNESQGYYESFLDANNAFKQGKISEKEFFSKLGDYTVAYSALEFLAVRALFEVKKALDKMSGGVATSNTELPGAGPGSAPGGLGNFGTAAQAGGGMTAGSGSGMTQPQQQPQAQQQQQSSGAPPSIVSSPQSGSQSASVPASVPSPEAAAAESANSAAGSGVSNCPSCGSATKKPNAKFCTKCGTKLN